MSKNRTTRHRGRVVKNGLQRAAQKYVEFHGHEPTEIFEVTGTVHEHSKLSGMGVLESFRVVNLEGEGVTIEDLGECLLAQNEDGNQVFIVGGDQELGLEEFGIDRDGHELEILGMLTDVWYFTNKTHLIEKDGGEATYHHTFGGKGRRRPTLVYDVRNAQLLVAGGDYQILPEGIFE